MRYLAEAGYFKPRNLCLYSSPHWAVPNQHKVGVGIPSHNPRYASDKCQRILGGMQSANKENCPSSSGESQVRSEHTSHPGFWWMEKIGFHAIPDYYGFDPEVLHEKVSSIAGDCDNSGGTLRYALQGKSFQNVPKFEQGLGLDLGPRYSVNSVDERGPAKDVREWKTDQCIA